MTGGELLIRGRGRTVAAGAHAARVSWSAEPFTRRRARLCQSLHRHVRAVALEGDGDSTHGLRFEFVRFQRPRAGVMDAGRARTTRALPGSLTVISVVAE